MANGELNSDPQMDASMEEGMGPDTGFSEEALMPADRGESGSPISISAMDMPELSDLAVGDTITLKVANVSDDGMFELMAVPPGSSDDASGLDGLQSALGVEGPAATDVTGQEAPVNLEDAL